MFRTLRSKLILSYVAIAVLSLLLALSVTFVLARDYARRNGFQTLQEKKALALPYAQAVIASELQLVTQQRPNAPRQLLARSARESIRNSGLRLLLLDPDSMLVIEDTSRLYDATGKRFSLDDGGPGLAQALTNGGVQGTKRIEGEDVTLQYIAQRIRLNPARQGTGATLEPRFAIVVLAQAEPPRLEGLFRDIIGYVMASVAVALLVSLIIAFLLARSIARPVARLASAAAAMSRGHYAQSLPVTGRDEIASLTTEFNSMANEVDKAHRMERDFIANVSHDLKTPLTSILGFSQAILDGAAKDEAGYRQAASIIRAEAEGMSRLVGRLLDLSRLQAGLAQIELRPIDLDVLLTQIGLALQPQAAASGVELTCRLHRDGTTVLADVDALREALSNVVENAIKYTPAGGSVLVESARHDSVVQVVVRDTGKGIPPGELPRIMERFYQVDKSRSGIEPGRSLGLGLAIVREVVQAHRGTIEITSEVGQGTTVTIRLPGVGNQPPRVRRIESTRGAIEASNHYQQALTTSTNGTTKLERPGAEMDELHSRTQISD